jgi:hypothetical protein
MKKIILTLFLVSVGNLMLQAQYYEDRPDSTPQIERNWNVEKAFSIPEFSIYGTFGYQNYNNYDQQIFIGIGGEYRVGDHWSVNYRIQAGPNYVHMPLSLPTGLLIWLWTQSNDGGSDLGDFTKFLMFIPEGATYSFDLFNGMMIKPYINPLGLTYVGFNSGYVTTNSNLYVMLSSGAQMQLSTVGNWSLSAYGEYRISWGGMRKGAQTGARISYNFN